MDGREERRRVFAPKTAEERAEIRRRRAEASWYAWSMEEFLRYSYAVGLLALLLFVPLQMVASWLPNRQPPVVSPALVALLAFAFDTAVLYLGLYGYQILWRDGGVVDRMVTRRAGRGR